MKKQTIEVQPVEAIAEYLLAKGWRASTQRFYPNLLTVAYNSPDESVEVILCSAQSSAQDLSRQRDVYRRLAEYEDRRASEVYAAVVDRVRRNRQVRFSRAQLRLMVEACFYAVEARLIDLIAQGHDAMLVNCWGESTTYLGWQLSVLYGQVTQEDMTTDQALEAADEFVKRLTRKVGELRSRRDTVVDLEVRKCAEKFVDNAFTAYLALTHGDVS